MNFIFCFYLSSFVFECPAIVCDNVTAVAHGLIVTVFFTCMEGWLTLVSPVQLLPQKVLVLEIWKTAKNGEKSALFAMDFYQIHHFWYVFGHVLTEF